MLEKSHPFASGNRRTAFITTKKFLRDNNVKPKVPNNNGHSKILLGIREGYYNNIEIKEWLKNGKIRTFTRRN